MTIDHVANEPDTSQESPWDRGIGKMLAATPARTFRTEEEIDAVDSYLAGLLEDGAGCGTNTWSDVLSHSAHPDTYSARPRSDYCHVRGHPNCREGLARSQLDKHRPRFKAAYPENVVVCLRLTASEGTTFLQMKERVELWERRRTVRPILPPMFGAYCVGDDGRYGLTLLAPDIEVARIVGDTWAEDEGNEYVTSLVDKSPFGAAVALKIAAEAATFEQVDAGVLSPERARMLAAEERGRRRTKFAGGFLGLVTAATSAGPSEDKQPDVDETEVEAGESRPTPEWDRRARLERFAYLVEAHTRPGFGDEAFEYGLRQLRGKAADAGDTDLVGLIDEQLELLAPDIWSCPIHTRCRLEDTGLRTRSRFVREAVEAGRASTDPDTGLPTWSDESWPWWRKLAQPVPADRR